MFEVKYGKMMYINEPINANTLFLNTLNTKKYITIPEIKYKTKNSTAKPARKGKLNRFIIITHSPEGIIE